MSHRIRRLSRWGLTFLAVGFLVTCVVAIGCAALVDISTASTLTAYDGEWSVVVNAKPGAGRVIFTRQVRSWSPMQATGAPDTAAAGDFATAWAPASINGSPEWLLLTYDRPLQVRSIKVYETYNPGALTAASLITDSGREIPVWSGTDPTPPGSGKGISSIPVAAGLVPPGGVRRVKLYQGKSSVPGWNEIDAVGVVDEKGATHWATSAQASSYYGQPFAGASTLSVSEVAPSWAGLQKVIASSEFSKSVVYAADARGWPMVAFWSPVPLPQIFATSSSPSGSAYTTFLPAAPRVSNSQIPWHPVWPGLLLDTAVFAAASALLWWLLTRPRRFILELSRIKRGCCVRCGYDLGYDFPAGCPECGWRRGQ